MSAEDAALMEQVYAVFAEYQAQYPQRPKGWVHSDLFRDNTLFEGDELKGILDFFELNFDELLFDVAITINDFCSQFPNVELDADKLQAYLDAYQQIRALTADEQACLNVYLAMAACRFWFLRLNVARLNAEQGRGGDDVHCKNPNEMRAMLQQRLSLVSGEK